MKRQRITALLLSLVLILSAGCAKTEDNKSIESSILAESTSSEIASDKYDISGLSTEELYNECLYYWNAMPKDGDAFKSEDYLKKTPWITENYPNVQRFEYSSMMDTKTDCITEIKLNGVALNPNMDGSTTVATTDHKGCYVTVDIYDYDRALAFYTYVKNARQDLIENKDKSTYWFADNGATANDFRVSMEYIEANARYVIQLWFGDLSNPGEMM